MTTDNIEHIITENGTLIVTVMADKPAQLNHHLWLSILSYLSCEGQIMGMDPTDPLTFPSATQVEILSIIENPCEPEHLTYVVRTPASGYFDIDLYVDGNMMKICRGE